MNKLSVKLTAVGWIAFVISFMILEEKWSGYTRGVAAGLFISAMWVMYHEYKNQ